MAVTYGFFNSVNGDRRYNAEQFGSIFDGVIHDGVFLNYGEHFVLKPSTNNNEILVGSGRAWFNHTWTLNDSTLVLRLSNSEPDIDRVDIVVIEVDNSPSVRANSIKVIKGGRNAGDPRLVNDGSRHQYMLGRVIRRAGVNKPTAADIQPTVGTGSTPFVQAPLEYIKIDEYEKFWKAKWEEGLNSTIRTSDATLTNWKSAKEKEYNSWLESIKGRLDNLGDVGPLVREIQSLVDQFNTLANEGVLYSPIEDSNKQPIKDSSNQNVLSTAVFVVTKR